jgi:hypothetical protein
MSKIFIIGLPRTGTTSVSALLLNHDFKVAHTALTKQAFLLADVISDTPCFCDYRQLDRLFPGSKYIYLHRDVDSWLPSIKMLLNKIDNHIQQSKHLNPVIKRCFDDVIGILSEKRILDKQHLTQCYNHHQDQVKRYFSNRDDLLQINLSENGCLNHLLDFLNIPYNSGEVFPHLNRGRMITEWRDIKHPNKVDSNASGPERRKFFDY